MKRLPFFERMLGWAAYSGKLFPPKEFLVPFLLAVAFSTAVVSLFALALWWIVR